MPIIRYKVLVAQVDSTELDMQQELGLDSVNVYFTDAGYTSDNVQDERQRVKEKNENSTFIYMNQAESRLNNSFIT